MASRILISNCHKNTSDNFFESCEKLYNFKDVHGEVSIISKEQFDIISQNKDTFQNMLNYDRDYLIDYFGFKTLEDIFIELITLLLKDHNICGCVFLFVFIKTIYKIKTYDLMSQKYFTHATPTLFNAGTPRPQLSSYSNCYGKR